MSRMRGTPVLVVSYSVALVAISSLRERRVYQLTTTQQKPTALDSEGKPMAEDALQPRALWRTCEEYQNLQQATGFFWGVSGKYEETQTGEFIEAALQAIDDGYEVIYTSWW